MRVSFNNPYFTGRETDYIRQVIESGKISGDGISTEKCHLFLKRVMDLERHF
jgi:dTDP-4-amino-4,6-dideoxygalactose transaminase